VLGHQNLSCEPVSHTYGTETEALDPLTVGPDKVPTVIVAPSAKFAPAIVTCWLAPPNVTVAGVTELIDGAGAVTTNPAASVPPKPPDAAGLVTVTAYDPASREVLGHQNLS
jgi:hypothetical protein